MPFDLEAALTAPPTGWAVCREDSPILPNWMALFGRDYMPLATPGCLSVAGFGKTTQRMVVVSVDHMSDAELDRFVDASLADADANAEDRRNLARSYRNTGEIHMGGLGVVVAPTLEAARDLARREAYPERN